MNEMKTVLDHIKGQIEAQGITALFSYPMERAKRYEKPVAVFGFKSAEEHGGGMFSYIGQRYDEKTGTCSEIYGKRLEYTLSLTVMSPYTAEESDSAENVMLRIISGLEDGGAVKLTGALWDRAAFDERQKMYKLCGELKCLSYILAEKDEDSAQFTDFVLKGEHK